MSQRKTKRLPYLSPKVAIRNTTLKTPLTSKKQAVKKSLTTPSIQSFFLPARGLAKSQTPQATDRGLVKKRSVVDESKDAISTLSDSSKTPEEDLDDYDSNQQIQGLHVAKRQKTMREFMVGKEAHPFFSKAYIRKPVVSSQQKSFYPRITNPTEAPLPGSMYYASYEVQDNSDCCRLSLLPIKTKSQELQYTSLKLTSAENPIEVLHGAEEFFFPSSPKVWIDLFKMDSVCNQLDERCYRDFLQDSTQNGNNVPGDWLRLYSATSTKHFLGNQSSLADVRVWLENWKLIACSQDVDSDDDTILFVPLSDDDSDYGSSSSKRAKPKGPKKGIGKVLGKRKKSKPKLPPITILSGPSGVGKTAAAHACAHDCGYKVLEINATTVRTGSELTSLVGQLSKSHLVNSVKSADGFFQVKKQASLAPKSPKPNLLILIDEVDLLFHGERSFLTTLVQLATETRRPFILTTNGPIPDLNIPKALVHASIKLTQAPSDSLVTFLQLMCLNEHLVLPQPLAYALVRYHRGDFRKLVHELEFMSRTQSSSNNVLPAVDAIKHLLPAVAPDALFLDSSEEKVVTLLSTPHHMLGQNSTDSVCKDDLNVYLDNHFSALHRPSYGWASDNDSSFWPCNFSEEDLTLEACSLVLDALAFTDTFNPNLLELDSLHSPESCLLSLPLLDADEMPNQFNPIKAHICPNKPSTFPSPDFLPPKNWCSSHLPLPWKNIYSSEFVKGAFSLLNASNSNLLELALGGSVEYQHRTILQAALSSVLPPYKIISSFNDNVCLLLPHLSQLIKTESSRTSRLRSQKTLTSKRFPRAKSSQLDVLVRYGLFNQAIVVASSQATLSMDSDDYSSSQDFYP